MPGTIVATRDTRVNKTDLREANTQIKNDFHYPVNSEPQKCSILIKKKLKNHCRLNYSD